MRKLTLIILACLCGLLAQAQKDSTVAVFTPVTEAAVSGSLFIASTPLKADVMLNGQKVGKTPILLKDMPVGRYDIVLKMKKYYQFMTRPEIREGEVGRLDVNLIAKNRRRAKKDAEKMAATIVIGPDDPDGSFARMPEHPESSSWVIIYESGDVFDFNNF